MSETELLTAESELLELAPTPLSSRLLGELELQLLAGELAAQSPAPLRSETAERLESAVFEAELSANTPKQLAEEYLAQLSLAPLNAELSTSSTAALDDGLLTRLTLAAENASTEQEEDALEPNIISFPQTTPYVKKKSVRSTLSWIGSAAAVALLGIFCGLAVLSGPEDTQPALALHENAEPATVELVPASAKVKVHSNRTLLNAQDRGIFRTTGKNDGYRAYRIEAMETYFIEDSEGKKIEIRKPKHELIFVPAVTD